MPIRLPSLAAARSLLGKKASQQLPAENGEPPELKNSITGWRKVRWAKGFKLGPEDAIQLEILNYLRQQAPGGWVVFHVPSAAKRSKVVWAWLLVLGFFAGFPDLIILMPRGRVAFIEVKRTHRESDLTLAQKAFRSWCQVYETPYLVATGVADVQGWLTRLESST